MAVSVKVDSFVVENFAEGQQVAGCMCLVKRHKLKTDKYLTVIIFKILINKSGT